MNIQIITDFRDFDALEPEWNTALRNSRADNPFLRFEWLKSWLDTYKDDIELLTIVAYDNTGLIGAAPFVIDKKGRLVFIGYPLADYSDIIIVIGKEDAWSAMLDAIFAGGKRRRKIILDQLRQDGITATSLPRYLAVRRIPFRIEASDQCPAMVLDDIEQARKIYYKRNINTYVNWFNKQGDFHFNQYDDTQEALERLDDLFAQHRRRRDTTPFPSQFEDDKTRSFFRKFVAAMNPAGIVRLFSLSLDDAFPALYIAFDYNDQLYLYTTSFNIDYAKRSPGQVILRYLFDYAVERGIKRLDFARGDEGYKDRFANAVRQNARIIVYNNALSKTAADLFHRFRYSKIVDILYRNRYIQSAKHAFLYYKRKAGLGAAISKSLHSLTNPGKRV